MKKMMMCQALLNTQQSFQDTSTSEFIISILYTQNSRKKSLMVIFYYFLDVTMSPTEILGDLNLIS
jgi:hypothetical protein